MFHSTATLLAAAALLAASGCNFDELDRPTGVLNLMDMQDPPATSYHEVHRMFKEEKQRAAIGDLPDQF